MVMLISQRMMMMERRVFAERGGFFSRRGFFPQYISKKLLAEILIELPLFELNQLTCMLQWVG